MGVQWGNYRIGIRNQHSTLFIGKVKVNPKTGKEEWSSQSGNRTEEIITTVIEKFRRDLLKQNNPDKPYVGYNIPGGGKLLFIKDGYEFSIRPSARKKT